MMHNDGNDLAALVLENSCSANYVDNAAANATGGVGSGGSNIINTITVTVYFFTFPEKSELGDVRANERDKISKIICNEFLPDLASAATLTYPPSIFDDEEVGVQVALNVLPQFICGDHIYNNG